MKELVDRLDAIRKGDEVPMTHRLALLSTRSVRESARTIECARTIEPFIGITTNRCPLTCALHARG